MALHTDTEIYKATYALAQLVTQLVANMPRNFKADFGAGLRRQCMALVMRTYQANTSQEKAPILGLMREEVEAINLSLRLAVDLRLISHKQFARAITLTTSIGKQATGWQKHSERAPAAGLSRQVGHGALESGRAAGPQAHRQAQQGYRRQQPQ
ncbi:four helix bundle protein [Delftia tsuruhatensis]|uniref:four helix bundle protein n=1 Tax=Delftia tsuruhatensis TaxID=180282 RepID=UPI0024447AEA|nr:four helix bundle protein [Delftia tsuruhatensis]MDH0774779.1 four helix bundle protein [Delftia tsuruhatensis]MDH1458735.1 four helix bundle protein [Delftia tsuruhatensis]MDH1826922.1 four helix bundle protein [Delftia tsuruhatensis]WGG09458.1 four helix bundle protein [Delftia tsuruhatensis]